MTEEEFRNLKEGDSVLHVRTRKEFRVLLINTLSKQLLLTDGTSWSVRSWHFFKAVPKTLGRLYTKNGIIRAFKEEEIVYNNGWTPIKLDEFGNVLED